MADIAITAANFLPSAQAVKKKGKAAGTITRSQPVYYSQSDGGYKFANVTSLGGALVEGLACEDVAVGQDFLFVVSDPLLKIGGTVASGDTLWASATGITKTFADLVATWAVVVLGIANADASTVNLNIVQGGVK